MTFNAPHIDYSGLSPVIALTAGIVVVLLVGCAGPGGPSSTPGAQADRPAPPAPKHLTVGVSEDPGNLWDAVTGGGGSGAFSRRRR